MKTFDIALKYLKDLDFSSIDLYADTNNLNLSGIVKERHELFSESNDSKLNSYYRNMVFLTCVHHLVELENKRVSFFDVACEIIESERDVVNTKFERYKNTTYPKVMMDKFVKYCNGLSPQPSFLSDESEVRLDFFATAYHYIIDDVS